MGTRSVWPCVWIGGWWGQEEDGRKEEQESNEKKWTEMIIMKKCNLCRYMDSFNLVSKAYTKRLQQEAARR